MSGSAARWIATMCLGAAVLGGLAWSVRPSGDDAPAAVPSAGPPAQASRLAAHARAAREAEIRNRFEQAVAMLHARRFDHAVTALHRLLELAPRMPEAHVNMGFALLGKGETKAAADFFESAIALKSDQINAYYGLAVAAERRGDLDLALGAMRTFVHRAATDNPYRRKAEAAIWEWESARTTKGTGRPIPLPAR